MDIEEDETKIKQIKLRVKVLHRILNFEKRGRERERNNVSQINEKSNPNSKCNKSKMVAPTNYTMFSISVRNFCVSNTHTGADSDTDTNTDTYRDMHMCMCVGLLNARRRFT